MMIIVENIIINFILILHFPSFPQYFLDSFNGILLNSFRPCASRGEILFPLRSALLLSELNNEGTHFISNTRPFVSTRPSRQIKQEIFVFFRSFLKCLFWKDRLVCQEQNFSNILKTFRKDLGQKSFCSLTNRKTSKLWFYK